MVDCRLVHTVKIAGNGQFWLGTLDRPRWLCLEGSIMRAEALETLKNQIIALHTQHRRRIRQSASDSALSDSSFELLASEDGDRAESAWRLCCSNGDFSLCPTYPRSLLVPSSISDAVIRHAASHRVKQRLPILAYQHGGPHGPALVRSGQPLVGLKRNRSIQDEHLLDAYRTLNGRHPERPMLIIDARPTMNALANTIVGAGFEPLEWYRGCTRSFVNLENIHHIRAAFLRLPVDAEDWVGHLRRLLTATRTIVGALDGAEGTAVLVHCSDGWDRTSQLVSLAKVCLDPQYRTLDGLRRLLQEDWLDAGHRFQDRLAQGQPLVNALPFARPGDDPDALGTWLLAALTKPSLKGSGLEQWCPIFPQFLDCLAQLIRASPEAFAYGPAVLLELYRESLLDASGLLAGNCQAERGGAPAASLAWDSLFQSIETFDLCISTGIITPDADAVLSSIF